MNTSKALLFTVTPPSAPIPFPIVRSVELIQEEGFAYQAFRYSQEGKSQDAYTFSHVASELALLCSPLRELTVAEIEKYSMFEGAVVVEEGALVLEEIETSKVLKFLITYGQVGIADSYRRTQFRYGKKINVKEVKNFCDAVGIYQPREVARTIQYYEKNPSQFVKKIKNIAEGIEVPHYWVQRDLRDLYRCVRILELLANKKEKSFKLEHSPELRRLLCASDRSPLVIPFGKDSGTYRPLDTKWHIPESDRESLVEDFTDNVNRFLTPLTYNVMQTEKQRDKRKQLNSIETFLIYSIMTTEGAFKEKFCLTETCRRPFYAQRISHLYHSDACNGSKRQKKYRENKKVSVQKNGKKIDTKKGKND